MNKLLVEIKQFISPLSKRFMCAIGIFFIEIIALIVASVFDIRINACGINGESLSIIPLIILVLFLTMIIGAAPFYETKESGGASSNK